MRFNGKKQVAKLILLFVVVFSLYVVLGLYYNNYLETRYKREDIDGDGIDEKVRKIEEPDGTSNLTVIDEDGSIYYSEFNEQGVLVRKEKTDFDGNHFVWSEKKGEWLPDKNLNGIPDEDEQQILNKDE